MSSPVVDGVEVAALPGEARYRDVLSARDFRFLWSAQLAAGLGEAVAQVALPLLVYDLTGSAGLLGLVFVLTLAPKVVLAPIAGWLVDRVDRRRVMLVADIGRMVIVAFLPFSQAAWQVAAISMLIAIGSTFARPAETAAVPMVVPGHLIVRALSLAQVSQAAVRVVGPAVGAAIVATLGPASGFWLQAACFVVSVAFIARLRLPRMAPGAVDGEVRAPGAGARVVARDLRAELLTGLRIIWNNRVIRGITGAELVWSAAEAILVVGMVAYTERALELGDRAEPVFALIIAMFSAGTVAGALVAPRVEARFGRRFMLAFGYLGPLLLIPVGVVPPLAVVFGCFFVFGLADSWLVIAREAYIVETVPNALRGRFYASWRAVITAGHAAWYGTIGLMTERLGAPETVLFVGLFAGIGCPLVIWLSGAARLLGNEVLDEVLRDEC